MRLSLSFGSDGEPPDGGIDGIRPYALNRHGDVTRPAKESGIVDLI